MNDVATQTQQGTAVGAHTPSKAAAAHTAEGAKSRGNRTFLKFSKGDWSLGKNDDPFPSNTFRFVPAMALWQKGFQCWKAKQIVDEKFVDYGDEDIDPTTLKDHGPYAKDDGWSEAIRFPLIILPDDRGVKLTTSVEYGAMSAGGRNACRNLSKQYAEALKNGLVRAEDSKPGPDEKTFIVVEAGFDSYQHKEYGKTKVPTFKIVDYLSANELEAILKKNAQPAGGAPTQRDAADQAEAQGQRVAAAPANQKMDI